MNRPSRHNRSRPPHPPKHFGRMHSRGRARGIPTSSKRRAQPVLREQPGSHQHRAQCPMRPPSPRAYIPINCRESCRNIRLTPPGLPPNAYASVQDVRYYQYLPPPLHSPEPKPSAAPTHQVMSTPCALPSPITKYITGAFTTPPPVLSRGRSSSAATSFNTKEDSQPVRVRGGEIDFSCHPECEMELAPEQSTPRGLDPPGISLWLQHGVDPPSIGPVKSTAAFQSCDSPQERTTCNQVELAKEACRQDEQDSEASFRPTSRFKSLELWMNLELLGRDGSLR